MLVYGLDLWIYPKGVSLLLIMLLYYLYFGITFTKQQWRENRCYLFEQHRLALFVNFDRQVVLCSMFVSLFSNCFLPFVPLYHCVNVLVSVIACYSLVYL